MGTKEKIGALILLSGVALIGVYWFKKNKPTIASSQAKGLQELSNFYKSGGTDDPYIKGFQPVKVGNFSLANVNYSNLTTKEKEDLKKAIGTIPDPSAMVSNQIAQNLQGADFSSLANIGLAGVTFNMKK